MLKLTFTPYAVSATTPYIRTMLYVFMYGVSMEYLYSVELLTHFHSMHTIVLQSAEMFQDLSLAACLLHVVHNLRWSTP